MICDAILRDRGRKRRQAGRQAENEERKRRRTAAVRTKGRGGGEREGKDLRIVVSTDLIRPISCALCF
jgi:hypothetical protein